LSTANGQYNITAPKARVRQFRAIDNKAVLLLAALTEHLPSRLHLRLKQKNIPITDTHAEIADRGDTVCPLCNQSLIPHLVLL
jgi:hypothetical protein